MSPLLLERKGTINCLMVDVTVSVDVRHVRGRAGVGPGVIGDGGAVGVEAQPRVEVHVAATPEQNDHHERGEPAYCIEGALYVKVCPQVQEEARAVQHVKIGVYSAEAVLCRSRALAAVLDDLAGFRVEHGCYDIPLNAAEGTGYGVHKETHHR